MLIPINKPYADCSYIWEWNAAQIPIHERGSAAAMVIVRDYHRPDFFESKFEYILRRISNDNTG